MTATAIPTTQPSTQLYGVMWVCLFVLLWTAVETIGGLIPSPYSPYQTVWMRYGTHLLFMLIAFGPRHKTNLVYTHRPGMQLFRSLMMFGMPVFFIKAVQRMSVSGALSIFWIAPILVMLLSLLLLDTSIGWSAWIAALASFAGTLMILRPHLDFFGWSAFLPLGMAFCFSLYIVMTQMLSTEETRTNLFYTAAGVFFLLSLGMPFFWQPLTLYSASLMVSIGLIGYVVLFTLDKSLEFAPASTIAPFIYTQPVWLVILTYLSSGHFPGKLALLGVAIIVASGLYLIYKN
jgi:drug/metabolite transporter (DMT)-like permease